MKSKFQFSKEFKIGKRWVGENHPAYIIADIGANFDGDLGKAKKLALAVKEAGGDCVKIQSFKAKKIVSGKGFSSMKLKGVHGSWGRPVDEIFKEVEFPRKWHKEFFDYCRKIGITPSSSPYDFEAVDLMEKLGADFYKIGSGDITWLEMIEYIANKRKPVVLATGAATLAEVDEAVKTIEKTGNKDFALLQCITNYPSKIESANIKVLDTYKSAFNCVIGYSDHTYNDTVVLGSIALGAKVIEKHFTLNKKDKGPDHPHSMEPAEFALMVKHIREMESGLGTSKKEVVEEESETVYVQRRGLCAARPLKKGAKLKLSDIEILRPALGIPPKFKVEIVGKILSRNLVSGEPIKWSDIS